MDFPFMATDFEQNIIKKYGSIENLINVARNGCANTQALLGMAHSEGVSGLVAKDSEKATGWLNAAVENG